LKIGDERKRKWKGDREVSYISEVRADVSDPPYKRRLLSQELSYTPHHPPPTLTTPHG